MTRIIFLAAVLLSLIVSPSVRDTQAQPAAEATGYVQVKQIDGVWWFIGPDGDKFVSLGVNHIEPHLWLAPYNKEATLKRYGRDMVTDAGIFNPQGKAVGRWIDRQIEICGDLHFNTFGKHTHPTIDPTLYNDRMYYIASLETAPLAGWQERNGNGPRPDVFSADFEIFLDRRARQVCAEHKGSRSLLGYLYTDVPSWIMGKRDQNERDEHTMIYPWINAILPLGESSPGKQRWIEHLRERYECPEAAAEVWGLSISPTYGTSWEKMARLQTWFKPADADRAKEDMIAFMYVISDQWYRMHHEAIRKYDPNHLILGDKNMIMWHYEWMIPAMKEYVDVVTIQAYGRWEQDEKLVERLYEQLGKPVYNGDGSYSYVQPNQKEWGAKGWRTNAQSFKEVAEFYQETLEGMMSTPYMIGWHHCGCLEQWDPAERGDSPMNENGFMDPFENYHTEWTDVIRTVSARASELHEAAK
jgi:hypothetical protein